MIRTIFTCGRILGSLQRLTIVLLAGFTVLSLPAKAGQAGDACLVDSRGHYLRADGQARKRWSVRAPDQQTVYVERCLLEQLLSYFPIEMQSLGQAAVYRHPKLQQPAAWQTEFGRTILTLSPASRFQVAAAILYVESEFHPNTSPSSAGAIGPFQIMPTTGDQMGMPRVGNQAENFAAGLKYILYIEEQIARHCDAIEENSKENSSDYRNLIAVSYHAGPAYMARADENGRTCRLEAFPRVSRTEYLKRFNRALTYRYLPATLEYRPR